MGSEQLDHSVRSATVILIEAPVCGGLGKPGLPSKVRVIGDAHVNCKGGLKCDSTLKVISTIAVSTCTLARVCILHPGAKVLVHQNIDAVPEAPLQLIAAYRDDLVIGAECMFTWYWLVDLRARERIRFVLGHALDLRAAQLDAQTGLQESADRSRPHYEAF
jgi:hypothetical protein